MFNYENFDEFDSSEDCLVAKVLLGLIFNPFVPANSETKYRLSREFLRYYLDDKVNDLDFSKAEILFKPKYPWFNTDKKEVKKRTAPDLLLLFPKKVIIALEVKYALPIQDPTQLAREYEGLKFLKSKFSVNKKYLLLLMTHQRLLQHIKGRSKKGLGILRKCCKDYGDEFRVNTWNCVYQAVQNIDAEYLPSKKEILTFLKKKQNYMTNPLDGSKKKNLIKLISRENDKPPLYRWDELRDRITGKISYPPDIPRTGGLNIFGKHKVLAQKIIEMSCLNLQKRGKHWNLRKKRVKAQLHPSPDGVDLAIPEADEDENLPRCEILERIPIQSLHDYSGPEKDWLEGNGKRFTKRPAAAFHIPGELENNPDRLAWQELEALLKYARKDC